MVLGFRFRRRHEQLGEDVDLSTFAPPTSGATVAGSEASRSTGIDTFDSLRSFEEMHHLDPNLPIQDLREVDAVLESGNVEKGVQIEHVLVGDNSPYLEVRSVVRNDDTDVPANTIRAWTIGLILCTIGSAINSYYSLRSPTVVVSVFVIQLVAYPVGLLWDLLFPDHEFDLFGVRLNFRPGKFNIKEHVIIFVMSHAAYGGGAVYATDVIIAHRKFFNQPSFGYAWEGLFAITTLCTGFGLAGLARRFLVWPASMIWPVNLPYAALFHAMHGGEPPNPAETARGSKLWSISRSRWFLVLFGAGFVWHWFPSYLFQGLTWFCWLTWIWPQSVIVNQLFGGFSGYGLMPITFDWTVISSYLGSPLAVPFHAIANTIAGVLVIFVCVSMGLQYSSHWYADFLPVQTVDPYDNTGQMYWFPDLLDENSQFDVEAYRSYSPLFFSTQSALAYGVSLAACAAVLVHVALYHGPELWTLLRVGRSQEHDVHMRLMRKYRDAPEWWFAVLLVVMVGMSFVVVCAWPTGFPWWAYIVCILIWLVWTVPIGIVQAMTSIQIGLHVLTEYVMGYMVPGQTLAMMMFKNYGNLCMTQALFFAQDMKLGHYMKVPSRVLFWAQLVASVWSAILQVIVSNVALDSIPNVCADLQPDRFGCDGARGVFSSSIIWAGIGPARIFGPDSPYSGLQWFWLAGAAAPVGTWLLVRRWPRSSWRYVNMSVFFGGPGWIPPATVYTYLCWGIVGTIFSFVFRRRFRGWWARYNYITSAALDCGVAVASIVIFFALYLQKVPSIPWFGNAEALGTLDRNFKAVKSSLPHGGVFGPDTWS